MEAEARESQERFQMVFDNAFDGISIFSEDPDPFKRKLVDCNERYAAMAGRSREELLKFESPQTLMVPLEDTTNKNRLESLNKGTVYQGYSSWIRPDGKGKYYWVCGYADHLAGKAYTIGIDRDITERKRAENELRKLSRAVEQSPASVIITDTNGSIEYINPKVTKLQAINLKKWLAKIHEYLVQEKNQKMITKFFGIRLFQERNGGVNYITKRKNGELYWESALISPILNERGAVTNFIAIKEDITEQKRILEELIAAKEKAEQSDKLKSEFLSQVSHEIKTPLITL